MSSRRKWQVLLITALVGAVVVTRLDIPYSRLPLGRTIDAQAKECEDLQRDLVKLRKRRDAFNQQRTNLRLRARPFWPAGTRAPALQVQTEFEKLAREARVTVQTVGGLRVNKISENVRSVELSVRMRVPMRDLSQLLEQFEKAQRPLFWATCSIRPDNPRDPKGVIVSGKIRAYVLTPEATEFAYGKRGGV